MPNKSNYSGLAQTALINTAMNRGVNEKLNSSFETRETARLFYTSTTPKKICCDEAAQRYDEAALRRDETPTANGR